MYMNPFETRSDSFHVQKLQNIPKQRKQWGAKNNAFEYNIDNEDEDNFLEDLGFKKTDDIEESISKFSSHANYEPNLPTKSELIRTDSNAISEENASANDPANQTDFVEDKPSDMEDLLNNASNAEIEFMKQSLSNMQELMMKEVEDMNRTNRDKVFGLGFKVHRSNYIVIIIYTLETP